LGADSPELRLAIEMRNGNPEVREVALTSIGTGRAVRSADLRLKLDDLVEDALVEAALLRSVPTPGDWRDTALGRRELAAHPEQYEGMVRPAVNDSERRVTKKTVQAHRRRHQKVTEAVLKEVAEVYRGNLHDRPTQAVREHFGVKQSTASWYVRRARDAGYLGEALNGKAGER